LQRNQKCYNALMVISSTCAQTRKQLDSILRVVLHAMFSTYSQLIVVSAWLVTNNPLK